MQQPILGHSAAISQVRDLAQRVAVTEASVLILGETGSGKELLAKQLHMQSRRSLRPFVPVNCGALPKSLVEAELFGCVKGAFTGATVGRDGLLSTANGGTLFLDEIGELPRSMQCLLLRFLESGEFRRLGSTDIFRSDVRLVCATHQSLEKMIMAGRFREDLYYRINVMELYLPPLRERLEDLPELAVHLWQRTGEPVVTIDQLLAGDTLDVLQRYPWPGNVRELYNVMQHASVVCQRLPVLPEHLPQRVRNPLRRPARLLEEVQFNKMVEVLRACQGNQSKAAKELGINRNTLHGMMVRGGLLSNMSRRPQIKDGHDEQAGEQGDEMHGLPAHGGRV